MNNSNFGQQKFLEILEQIQKANKDEEIFDIYHFANFYIRHLFTNEQLNQIKAKIGSSNYCHEDILKNLFQSGFLEETYHNTRFQLTFLENPALLEELILKSDLSKPKSIPKEIYEIILNDVPKFKSKIFELNSSYAPDDIRVRLALLRVNLIYH